jgi:hypothetical protein
MNRILLVTAAPALLFGLRLPCARAQAAVARGVIDGTVSDTNLVPLADVEASIVGSSLRVLTGAGGRFQIVGLLPGQYVLGLQRRGYMALSATVQVTAGDTIRLSFTLEDHAAAPDTIASAAQVLVRRSEFETHRLRGRGQFITESEIAERKVTSVRELLRELSTVRIQGSFASSALAPTFRDACAFQLFVNGKPLKSTNIDGLPAPRALLGIEVYAGPEAVPLEYRALPGNFCGAILTWSKV